MLRVNLDLLPAPRSCDVAVVIDVLRMTTTAATLFARGLAELVVVAEVDEARALAQRERALLLGERQGVKVAGFDGGNSPLEYLEQDLTARRAVICTSNGSRAVEAVQAKHLVLGAIVNARASVERALALAERDVTLVCAGTAQQVSLDDVAAAGCLLQELMELEPQAVLSDSCKLALRLVEGGAGVLELLRDSRHGGILFGLGFDEDIAFAAKRNRYRHVPIRHDLAPARFRV